MPLSDFACFTALDSLEQRAVLPEGCEVDALVREGLIEPTGAMQWGLTIKGRLVLANLRSLERQRQKA